MVYLYFLEFLWQLRNMLEDIEEGELDYEEAKLASFVFFSFSKMMFLVTFGFDCNVSLSADEGRSSLQTKACDELQALRKVSCCQNSHSTDYFMFSSIDFPMQIIFVFSN